MRARFTSAKSIFCSLLWVICGTSLTGSADTPAHWPSWRGPLQTGEAPDAQPPTRWSESENILWKTEIPGKGHGTPVVWGNRIYLTTAVESGRLSEVTGHDPVSHEGHDGAHDNLKPSHTLDFRVLALDRFSGEIVWSRTVHSAAPHAPTHLSGSWASASPVTDGKRVYASFGSAGLFALTMKGKTVWRRDLGPLDILHAHGEGSSPALHGRTLVVNQDHEGASALIAVDTRNGKIRWKVSRDEVTSWSSPVIVDQGDTTQVIVAATGRTRGYSLDDGELLWEAAGLSRNVVASPVVAGGIAIVANSYNTRSMLAIDLARARGDISDSAAILWTRDRDTPYVPSPVMWGERVCFLKHYQGILTCVDRVSGELIYGPIRLPGVRNLYASPMVADGRLYFVSLEGVTTVLAAGDKVEVLAVNRLDESFAASPVSVGQILYLRGERQLYAIRQESVPASSRH